MTIDRRALAGALALLLLVAACGGGASPAPTSEPGATQASGTTAEPTEAAETPAPEGTPAAEETEGPTLIPGAAADLEAKLPSEVNGVKFERTSFDGESFPAGVPIGDSDLEKFLADNGKSLKDVKVALASPTDTENAGSLVMAIQVEGVSSDKMKAWAASTLDTGTDKTTLGGKEVLGSGAAGFGAYLYVKDDIVYYVLSFGSNDLAEGILSKLP
jgi:hypothetical protein